MKELRLLAELWTSVRDLHRSVMYLPACAPSFGGVRMVVHVCDLANETCDRSGPKVVNKN